MDLKVIPWHGTANPQPDASSPPDPARWPTGNTYQVIGFALDDSVSPPNFYVLLNDVNWEVSFYQFPLDTSPPFVLVVNS